MTLQTPCTDVLGLVGDLILHAQRGVLWDALSAYGRFLDALGRPLSDVQPMRAVVPFAERGRDRSDARVLAVADMLGRLLRALDTAKREEIFREIDSVFKGWALEESKALLIRALHLNQQSYRAEKDGDGELSRDLGDAAHRCEELSGEFGRWPDTGSLSAYLRGYAKAETHA